jgi:hypothetical protein
MYPAKSSCGRRSRRTKERRWCRGWHPRVAFKRTSLERPGIAVVGWSAGWNAQNANGKHWVVVAGTVSNGHFLILDPAFGIGYVDPAPAIRRA